MPCTSEFDTSFSLTPNFSWVLMNQDRRHRFNGFCRFADVVKLLKQYRVRRPAKHPSEEGC